MKQFTRYLDTFARINRLDEKSSINWFFHPGMLFLSRAKWWGDFKFRATRHEGIDICWYQNGEGALGSIPVGTQVPAFDEGRILNICNDFLGKTIVVTKDAGSHTSTQSLAVTAYAHIQPVEGISIGNKITASQVIATVSDTHKNPELSPHLHLACFEIPSKTQPEQMNWNLFTDSDRINMINPVFL